jgi:C1A family cysteine protease
MNNIPPTSTWITIDYTSKCGKVFKQGNCGCCYTFALLNSIECNYNMKRGVLPTLSRQQVVDCSSISHGCNGGNPTLVGIYAKSVGLMFDSDYPYIERENPTCKFDKSKSYQYIDGIEVLPDPYKNTGRKNPYHHSYSVYQMLTKGTVVVGIDGNGINDYKKGIVDLTDCYEDNHAVIIVGFGQDPISGPYWIIKNQWHTTWGENGYGRFKVKEDSVGNCFMNNDAIRPIIN